MKRYITGVISRSVIVELTVIEFGPRFSKMSLRNPSEVHKNLVRPEQEPKCDPKPHQKHQTIIWKSSMEVQIYLYIYVFWVGCIQNSNNGYGTEYICIKRQWRLSQGRVRGKYADRFPPPIITRAPRKGPTNQRGVLLTKIAQDAHCPLTWHDELLNYGLSSKNIAAPCLLGLEIAQ
jgi:hypothetical protein